MQITQYKNSFNAYNCFFSLIIPFFKVKYYGLFIKKYLYFRNFFETIFQFINFNSFLKDDPIFYNYSINMINLICCVSFYFGLLTKPGKYIIFSLTLETYVILNYIFQKYNINYSNQINSLLFINSTKIFQ